jgi:exocyst complex protein 7
MARVVDEPTRQIIDAEYAKTRSTFLKRTLRPLFEKSRDRPLSSGSSDVLDIAVYERLSHPFHLLARSLNFLAIRETDIIQAIFPDGRDRIFLDALQEALKSFTKIVNKLRLPVLTSHVDLLFDLDVLATLRVVMADLSLLCESTLRTERSMIVSLLDLMQPLIGIARTTLTTFADLVAKHDPAFVPPTGGVSALTSNSILFLIELSAYAPVLAEIEGFALPAYSTTILTRLVANLQGKSRHYKDDPVIPFLFLMNNAHYAYTAIKASPLATVVALAEMQNLEEITSKAKEKYLESTWATAVAKLKFDPKDGKEEALLKAQKLNKRQRMTLKHMFRDFHARIDEIMARHAGYSLRNQALMADVYAEAIKIVNVPYDRFWTKWKDRKFSKTPEKWISYQPPTLAEMISRLYGQDRKTPA